MLIYINNTNNTAQTIKVRDSCAISRLITINANAATYITVINKGPFFE